MALAILVFKNWTFAVLLPIMAVALFVLSNKTPQIINYAISPKGIYIADVLHDFSEFRAFGLIHENNQHFDSIITRKTIFARFNYLLFRSRGRENRRYARSTPTNARN